MKLNKKIISSVLIIFFVILILKIYYRYTILKQIRDSVIIFNNCSNYKIVDCDKTIYYKDGIRKEVSNNEKNFIWSDGNITYSYSRDDKYCLKNKAENFDAERITFDMLDFKEFTQSKLLMNSLDIFSTKIFKQKFYNEEKSISKEIIILKINKDIVIYFDIDTKLPLFYRTSTEEEHYSENITLNTVTNEDIKLNIDNYEIFDVTNT